MRLSLSVAASICLLGLAQAASASPLLTRDRAHARCLITQVQRIGAYTDEAASSVLAKARTKCIAYERALDGETTASRNYSDPNGSWVGTSKDELIERSERVAVEALLKARLRIARSR
ncbi:hypothetical protein V6R86_06440 [Sphingomonas kaistensis]|uniref:DUF1311 domain-containing protein n=1 Tax=Sphingomonas kaistensis TaxID=298708 RepID=A0ABZ2G2V4_9SPHN